MSLGLVQDVRVALAQRVAATLAALGQEGASELDEGLERVARAAADNGPDIAWLAFIALLGRFPHRDELAVLRRELMLDPSARALFRAGERLESRSSGALRRIRLVSDRPVIDVGHTATTDHNSGIQRVVRKTLPYWFGGGDEDPQLVVWTDDDRGYRATTERERMTLLAWGRDRTGLSQDAPTDLIVPWRTTVVLPEVVLRERAPALAALAADSGNRVTAIGYDLIPLISRDLVDPSEANKSAAYVEVIKHSAVVAGISRSAAREFEGLVTQLSAQGLEGPRVIAIPLGEEALDTGDSVPAAGDLPIILCVGSQEPRKNQTAVLAAASLLQRAGVAFRLVFVGGGPAKYTIPFDAQVAALVAAGVAVEAHRSMGDAQLAALYARARCTVMVSLHEGYGLPVVESLARGVPVVCSDHGSLAEIAESGGCILVDAHDPVAIADALGSLLRDDALAARLAAEASARPTRTWADYAAELHQALIGGDPR